MRYDLIDQWGEVVAIADTRTFEEVEALALELGVENAWPYVWAQAIHADYNQTRWQACRRRKGCPPGHNEYVGPVFRGRDECKQWIADQVWEF